jgi:hypothetical protein
MTEEYANSNIDSNLKSITPPGFFGESANNIQSRENFITEEERLFLLNAARSITEWDRTETHYNDDGVVIYDASYWDNRVASRPILEKIDPEISIIIERLVARLKIEVDDFFNVDAKPTSPAIVRWMPGYRQEPHADKQLQNGEPNDFPWYDLAGLFYLNDDYDGGELYFLNHDVEFKPKPGAAYFFPGDINYSHGVREITKGIRYVIPFFWTILEHKGEKTMTDKAAE